MSRLRKAARTTLFAQAFNWAALLLSLATVPLYLHWLGQERYGVLLTGLAFAGYLMFSDAGLSWASMLLIAQANGREDRVTIASILRNSFSLAACSAVMVAIAVGGIYTALGHSYQVPWLPQQPEARGLMLAVGCSVVCTLGMSPFYNLFIGLQEAHIASIYQGSGRLAGTLASISIAATGAPLGWVFGANVVCALLTGVVAAVHCRRRHPWAFVVGSFWEAKQIQQQVRTGAKSFAMQIGNVLSGTAPVLAISSVAGAQFVPYFSIPLTLLNAPLGILSSFSASLQPGYGEAIGRGETEWVADTVRHILRQALILLGALGCGFILLAGPFVSVWTGGRIQLSNFMLVSVLVVAGTAAILAVFRFAITGINRHRLAAASDLVCGILALVFAFGAVSSFGAEWVGAGIAVAVLFSNGWILPRELHRALNISRLLPDNRFLACLALAVGISGGVGWLALRWLSPVSLVLAIVGSGAAITGLYLLIICRMLPSESVYLRKFAARFVPTFS